VEKIKQTVRPEREQQQEGEKDEGGQEPPGPGPSAAGAAGAGNQTKEEIRRAAESLPRPLP
jgi:hypothetical protein